MATGTTSKKRKREAADDPKVSFALSDQPKSQVGPVLVHFPSVRPSKSTPFKCYRTGKNETSTKGDADTDFADIPALIAGETDAVEFYSSDETRRASEGCRYFIGVHNKKTGVTTVRQAPLHVLTHQVKALKNLQPAAVSDLEWQEARAALGESFGTRTAKLAIKARERNKVDVSAMEGVVDHLQEGIQKATQALPSKEAAQAHADNARLVPAHNADAIVPGDIYPLHNIIPEAEWEVLSSTPFLEANGSKEQRALLPSQRSKWVNQHLESILGSASPSKTNIKVLQYVSCMMLFRSLASRNLEREVLLEKLSAIPSIVAESLLSRFTETARGSFQPQFTSQKETLLLTHMFALCLRVDDYVTDTELIAKDLARDTAGVNLLFVSLGCKITKLVTSDLKDLGLPEKATKVKRAVLKAPLVFPKPRAPRRRHNYLG